VTGLLLVAPGLTRELRHAVFGAGGDLDPGGLPDLLALSNELSNELRTGPEGWSRGGLVAAPGRACRQTAEALGADPRVEAGLADCDYGGWTGRRLAEVSAEHPDGVRLWLDDPDAAPHGGESVTALVKRVGAWLDGWSGGGNDRAIAVAPAAVLRAAVAHVLQSPKAYHRVDVAPLATIRLSSYAGRWKLAL
jgi:broad specificity phosphatase PhoE